MKQAILVPLDGSEFSEYALPAAVGLARELGGTLHLVRAHEIPLPVNPDILMAQDPEWDRSVREAEEEYLMSAANRCMEAGVSARTDLLDGPAAHALASYAKDVGVALVVMTTHGRGGISRAWVGSVADAVVRRSSAPVLLLRPQPDVEARELESGHVLIPLDGSRLSEGILESAVMVGSLTGARYTLLRVIVPVPPLGVGVSTAAGLDTVVESEAEVQAELAKVADPLRARGLDVATAVAMHPVPAVAILDWAAGNGVDLIAVATHGRGGWSRVALGSVADKVMRGAQVPVLLYRPAATAERS